MAATGIPKFDTGPQKSAGEVSFILPSPFASARQGNAFVFHGDYFSSASPGRYRNRAIRTELRNPEDSRVEQK